MTKHRFLGKIKIIDDKYVVKEENDLFDIYEYLNSRNFYNIIPIIERYDDKYNKYEYINDVSVNKYQKSEDLIDLISSLHNKTSFNKEVNSKVYKNIRDHLIGYINYLDKYYYDLIVEIEYHDFPSPSEQLILNNYTKIKGLMEFLKHETDEWYQKVLNKNVERVCLNHGKLDLSHIIISDKNYLISIDKNNFSSPINDLIYFYKKEWKNVEFKNLLNRYLNNCQLDDNELKLLLLNLAIPEKFVYLESEYKNTCLARDIINYIYKTEDLIRPYYSKNEAK